MAAREIRQFTSELPDYVLEEVRKSGLNDDTIDLAGIREAISSELPTHLPGVKGFVIPFFGVDGKRVPFTRVRVIHPQADPKYLQPPHTGQRIYLPPPGLVDPSVWTDPSVPIIIVEGEKKAMKLAQEGFACIGVTGVFSWRQRTYRFSKKNVTGDTKDQIILTFKGDDAINVDEQVAEELNQIVWHGRIVYILYDTDQKYNEKVQHAAFELGIWVDQHGGIPRQVILPRLDEEKTGPDDYFIKMEREYGLDATKVAFQALLDANPTFPLAPNLGPWIMRVKSSAKSKRAVAPRIARAIVANLDAHGRRFRNLESGEFYYLSDDGTFRPGLHTFTLTNKSLQDMRNTSFGKELMIRGHHIGTNEKEILSEVADLFASTPGIEDARPRKACFCSGDALYYQLNDVLNLKVNKDTIEEVPNGKEMLFYGEVVQPLDMDKFYHHLEQGFQGMWVEALKDFEVQPMHGLNKRQTRSLLAAVFHLVPWLRQWRGLAPPIEQAIAEASSGKSFLSQLRRGILTGSPSLDAVGGNMQDFLASISHAPGQWTGDNLNELAKDMRDDVQNMLARLVTDPDPHVSGRVLYVDNREARYPIDCSFSITAIRSPFNKPDIIQRSFVYHFRTIPAGRRNGTWVIDHLRQRERWVAEHILAVQNFFKVVDEKWDLGYRSSHRLVNFEQSVLLMLQVIGVSAEEAAFIVAALPNITNEEIVQNDPVIECLRDFAEHWYKSDPNRAARPQDIVTWVTSDMEGTYTKVYQVTNAISLGRWMRNNATILELSAGLHMITHGNQTTWRAIDPDKRGTMAEEPKE